MSQVYGPAPSFPPCAIVMSTVPALVTEVTAFAANCSSVMVPISMLPARRVRPHSLTMFWTISVLRMMFASVATWETWRPRPALEPFSPWALMMTPWPWVMAKRAGAKNSSCDKEGILSGNVSSRNGALHYS